MNFPALDLPPRRPLPSDVRARMLARVLAGINEPPTSRFERLRGPLAVAAGVTVLAAGAMMIPQSLTGSDDSILSGASPTSRTTPTRTAPRGTSPIPPTSLPAPPLDHAKAAEDLDRCWSVVSASPRAGEFSPRETWQPVFAVELNGHRITAYLEDGGRPAFCDVTATTATVSDPSAEPMSMGGGDNAPYYGLYLSPAGILAGVAQGVTRLECMVHTLMHTDPGGGTSYLQSPTPPTLRGIQFVVHVGALKDGDEIITTAFDDANASITGGGMRFERARVRPVGATGTDRP